MKVKKFLARVSSGSAAAMLTLSFLFPTAAYAFSGNGAGTADNPYKISNCTQLGQVVDHLSAHYVLTNNIDCSGGGDTVNGIYNFSGVFDGQNFTISHLNTYNAVYSPGYALFSDTDGATIKNLTVADSDIYGFNNAAGVVGFAENTTISNVHSSVTIVDGRNAVGGVVGWAYSNVSISNSSFTGTIQDGNSAVGGLVGALQDGSSITDSYVDATIEGGLNSVGGLAGVVSDSSITRSYAAGNQTNSSITNFAGLVGAISGSNFTNSFSDSTLDNDEGDVGGAIGSSDTSTISGVYYNEYTCSCSTGTITGSDDATAVNSANATPDYFRGNSTSAPLNGWDFDTVWQTNSGALPTLRTISVTSDVDGDGQDGSIESNGPNSGDANGDGTPDSAQSNVASFVNGVTGAYAAIETDCDAVQSPEVIAESANADADTSYEYPLGMMNFSLECLTNGATATVALYYFTTDSSADYSVRKYNPATGDYSSISSASISEATIGGQHVLKVIYQITDGGEYDADGEANGTILDPAGLAKKAPTLANTGQNQQVYVLFVLSLLLMSTRGLSKLRSNLRAQSERFNR